MSEVRIFNNNELGNVRVVMINNDPWFVGKDVAVILGYTDINHTITDHVEEEDRINSKTQGRNDPEFGQRGTWLVNESGLYSLIFSSKLPKAKSFKRWVTSEVLPSIRKHGAYMTDNILDKVIENPDLLIDLATQLKQERETNKSLLKQNEEMKPKALFADAVQVSDTDISVGALAKILRENGVNVGQNKLYEWLRKNDYLIKTGRDKNLPTQKGVQSGYFNLREQVVVIHWGYSRLVRSSMVTPKGQLYFVNKVLTRKRELQEKRNLRSL